MRLFGSKAFRPHLQLPKAVYKVRLSERHPVRLPGVFNKAGVTGRRLLTSELEG